MSRLSRLDFFAGLKLVLLGLSVDLLAFAIPDNGPQVWWRLAPLAVGTAVGGLGLAGMAWNVDTEPQAVEPPDESTAPPTSPEQ